jgi:hypothetical protein
MRRVCIIILNGGELGDIIKITPLIHALENDYLSCTIVTEKLEIPFLYIASNCFSTGISLTG